MSNKNYYISEINGPRVTINWSSENIDDVSFIFIDGVAVLNEYAPETIDREFRLNLESEFAHTVEIYDLPVGSTTVDCQSTIVSNFKHPVLKWNNVSDAKWFYVYYKYYTDTEYTLYRQILNNGDDFQWCVLGFNLVEKWYQIKITAVNDYGEESVVNSFNHRVLLPKYNDYTLAATGTGNIFNFTLGGI
jgi:hypothetical protein